MNQELRLLEEILKRNSEDPDSIDIENEVDHYFFFDGIGVFQVSCRLKLEATTF